MIRIEFDGKINVNFRENLYRETFEIVLCSDLSSVYWQTGDALHRKKKKKKRMR